MVAIVMRIKNLLEYIQMEARSDKIKIKETVIKLKKSNSASIPIMITMDMRKKLKILGYTLEEIKYLTPAESNDIIKKSIIKISGKDRGRNQQQKIQNEL